MICLMHEGTPYGYLKVNHKVILEVNLARILGGNLSEVTEWLKELEDCGVFSRASDGTIYSKRMVRDEEIREKRSRGGKKGGNPHLLEPKVNHKVKYKDNLEVNLKDNLPPNLGDNLAPNLGAETKVNQILTPSSASSTAVLNPTECGLELSKLRGETEPEAHPPSGGGFAEIPTVEEVVTFGNGGAAIPAWYCEHYHGQKEIKRSWLNGYGRLVDWQKEIVRWFTEDGRPLKKYGNRKNNGKGASAVGNSGTLNEGREAAYAGIGAA